MESDVYPRACANPDCRRPLPLAQPGHKARLTCGDRCRKAASRARKLAEARRREAEARRQRLECWQVFLPATRHSLERLEVLAGARLAEELAEAIRSEVAREMVMADWHLDEVTSAASPHTAEMSAPVLGGR
jgi:hypothetical protein